MTAVYEIRTYTPAGVLLDRFTDYLSLACRKVVNGTGLLSLELPGDHRTISKISHRSHIEVWKKDPELGISWFQYFGGLYLAQNRKFEDHKTFKAAIPGYNWLLNSRIINWPANTANRTKFTAVKAETIAKTLFTYNIGSGATVANGRKREGTITGMTADADQARGNTLDWFCFGDKLLVTLQKLAKVGGGDFNLVKTGTNTFTFYWYPGQLGTDRTSTVVFSLKKGNMGNPEYNYDRIEEQTVACVWGKGPDDSRAYATRTGADYSAGNDIEQYVDARDIDTDSGLNTRGDEKNIEARARESFTFDVLQTPRSQYDVHYFLGDKVTGINPFTGSSSVLKIWASTVSSEPETGFSKTEVEVQTV